MKQNYKVNFRLSENGNDSSEEIINKQADEDLSLGAENVDTEKKSIHTGHAVEKKLKELSLSAEKNATSVNWESTKNSFDETERMFDELDSEKKYSEIRDRFDEAKKIFERRYNNHLMVKKIIEEKEKLCIELEKLSEDKDYEAVTSKFNEIKSNWEKHDKIPERYEEVLEKRYKKLSEKLNDKISELKAEMNKNFSTKEMLEKFCLQAEELVNTKNWEKASKRILDIKSKWDRFPANVIDVDNLKHRFETAVSSFETKKEKCIKELEEKKGEIKSKVEEMFSQLEEYVNNESVKSVLYKVKDLQQEWEKIEKTLLRGDETAKKFNKLIKKYFSKLKFIQQKEDWERWENYTNKLLLCERVEKLLDEKDNFKVAKEINEIWSEWRKIGQAPREKNDEIWERFNSTRQKLKVRCNEFFSNLKEERKENIEVKQKLCQKAEELRDSTDWEKTAEKLKVLQQEWKDVGPAPKAVDDELYEKFRNACNTFFENRIEFYKELHKRQADNKKYKKELIEEAEELKDISWKEALSKISRLRKAWKRIGSAGKQDEEKLWHRFNSQIELFLDGLDASKPDNLKKKENICEMISDIIPEIQSSEEGSIELKEKIASFSSDWDVIGPVPDEVEKEIEKRYKDLSKQLSDAYQKLLEKKASANIKDIKEKELILSKIEGLVKEGKFEENKSEFEKLVNEWETSSVVENESKVADLNERFRQMSGAYSNSDKDYFVKLAKEKQKNLKRKIKICVDLEKLADIEVSDQLSSDNLAEELMFAIKGNFASDNNKRQSEEDIAKKFEKLQQEWDLIGVVPIEEYENINLRYNKICCTVQAKK